jgi:hypothetical protein
MIMFVSADEEEATNVLNLWVKAGISGITILESSGMHRLMHGIRDDVGLVVSLSSLLRSKEVHHRTLLSAIQGDETLQRVIDATTEYVGDWSKPHVGVLFAWSVAQAYGMSTALTQSENC